jgi:shikimate O-hydroxycinnamoyltransferase
MSKPKPTLVLSKRLHSGVKAEPQYLSGLDIFHAHAGIPLVLCFKQGFDLAHVEKALVATLASYPCVTGRYRKDKQGHVYLDSNDAGLDWNVYRCKGPLPYGPHHPVGSDIHRFYKLYMPWNVVDHDRALMQINIHQFEDGGILFCAYAPHSAQDGSSWWGMIQDWSRTCLGQELKGQSFDRQVLIDAGKVEADPAAYDLMAAPSLGQWAWTMARLGWQAVFGMKSESFRIPAKVVGQWREQAKAELPNSAGVSVAELATTYLMKAMSPAMPSGVARSVGLVLDLRYKRRLRLPRDLYGNALCYAEARYSAEVLASGSLPVLAEKCRPTNEQVSTEALVKMLVLTETYRQKKAVWRLIFKPTLETLNAGLIQNNCIQFPMYDIDFGTGTPSWFDITPMTIRMVMLVHTPEKDGGVDMHLTAKRAELAALKAQLARDGIPLLGA